ncbi:hypothetical protein STVIR_3273 [Streptomyces viridochromogenes Tue57]|uniref:Uncharacterized protein n=1 Tax=Streptomyces viridochromogenes Tue57 TaxID=1160705 RepID=L8PIS6_STRVR|nr:hypothetical protein STVIR_3273 [Streptomyces viridochromogenes Tue57]
MHPDGTGPGRASGPATALDDAALEALLSAAVLRGYRLDTEGEQRAVAAFRAARDAGAHRARTRRRDDWRPRERRLVLSLKTTLSLFLASLTLGGVAVAAIGSSDSSDGPADDQGRPSGPSTSAPDLPAAEHSSAASDAATHEPGHPSAAQDTEAQCRAYEQIEDRGNALDSTAWQRLVTAAGGEDKVVAYCAEQLARGTARSRPSQAATPGGGASGAANGAADDAGGNADDNAADNAESGADNAETGADNAETGADNAETGADNAETGADNAETGAERGAASGADNENAGAGAGGEQTDKAAEHDRNN